MPNHLRYSDGSATVIGTRRAISTIEHLVELRIHFDAWRDEMCRQAKTVIEIDTAHWDPRDDADLDALIADIRAALAD